MRESGATGSARPRRVVVAREAPRTLPWRSVIGRDNINMPKIRRGGSVILTWVGDHSPRLVHVYRDRRLIVEWDLVSWRPMKGEASRRVVRLLEELVEEGKP